MHMKDDTDHTIVLLVRENDFTLLRSVQGIKLRVVNYDIVEESLASDGALGEPPLPTDDAGVEYVDSYPYLLCGACRDWIGENDPRVAMGAGRDAVSYCLHCATAVPRLRVLSGLLPLAAEESPR